jgi:ADP-ribose pyrophosphatase YjhB (NUDIX family)
VSGESSQRTGREYPLAPIVGVAGVVICGDKVLLIRRGREPQMGAWSLPGGALELGETTAEGVAREVWEETGLRVRPVEMIATMDRIVRDDVGRVQYHYVLVDWFCVVEEDAARDLVCGDDAAGAEWVGRREIYSDAYGLGEPTLGVIEKALQLAEMRET